MKSRASNGVPEDTLYEPLDFVLVRAPLLPIEAYLALTDGPQSVPQPTVTHEYNYPLSRGITRLLADQRVRNALLQGSHSLAEALERGQKTPLDSRDAARLAASLLRYLIRMSTRPTPYGLFAGVALARWGAQTTLALANAAPRTRTRVDLGFLLELVMTLEARPEIRRRLRLVANPAAEIRAGRVWLMQRPPSKGEPFPKGVSLNATRVVRRTLELARRPVAYGELASALLAMTPQASPVRVDGLLDELWSSGILVSDLRPPLTCADPARYVLDRLAAIPEAGTELANLAMGLESCSLLDGQGGVAPGEDRAWFGASAPPAPALRPPLPLQVDMAYKLTGAQIGRMISQEAVRAAELLLQVGPWPAGPPALAAFRQAFLTRYGHSREVPLLELLDANFGLGSPYETVPGVHPVDRERAARRDAALLELVSKALCKGEMAIELDDAAMQSITTCSLEPSAVPPSLDVYVLIAAASPEAINRGEFLLVVGPNSGTIAAGRNLARFADLIGPSAVTALQAAARAEEARDAGRLYAELVYLPGKLRWANVAVRPAVRRYEIPLAVSPGVGPDATIPLDELLVGVRNGRFYLRWTAYDKEVVVTSGHMLNSSQAPVLARFLAELSRDGIAQLTPFDWGSAEALPFLPRVQAGRIVLRPAEWHLHSRSLMPGVGVRQALEQLRASWRIPRYVKFGSGDKWLLLDLEDEHQASELAGELHKLGRDETLVLQEALPGLEQTWLPGPGGRYVCELVVSLTLKPIASLPTWGEESRRRAAARVARSPLKPMSQIGTLSPQRLRPPGSDWLYAKLYIPCILQDEVISGTLLDFATEAIASGSAKAWSFVRYTDPEPHLRLRFNGEPVSLSSALMPALSTWATELIGAGLCRSFGFDSYERELERYGGPEGMELAECVFAVDSLAVARLLLLTSARARGLERSLLAVLSADALLTSFGLDQALRLAWYRQYASFRNESGAAYRQHKLALRALVAYEPKFLISQQISPAITDLLEERRAAMAAPASGLRELDQRGELTQPLSSLYASLLHLHFNRLLGANAADERRTLGLLLRTHEGLTPRAAH